MKTGLCEVCGRDISAEAFKYEDDAGRIVCLRCFKAREPAAAAGRRPRFSLLAAAAVLFRIGGFAGLAAGCLLALVRFDQSPLAAIEAALSGTLFFLVCIVVSGMIRIGISMESKVARIASTSERLLALMLNSGTPTATVSKEGGGEDHGALREGR